MSGIRPRSRNNWTKLNLGKTIVWRNARSEVKMFLFSYFVDDWRVQIRWEKRHNYEIHRINGPAYFERVFSTQIPAQALFDRLSKFSNPNQITEPTEGWGRCCWHIDGSNVGLGTEQISLTDIVQKIRDTPQMRVKNALVKLGRAYGLTKTLEKRLELINTL